jgi:zinc/manganese transport system substrate-binding protein
LLPTPRTRPITNATAKPYLKQIYALLAEAKSKLGALPPGNRKIVTSHDAFGYLGQAYGIDFMAPQGLVHRT